MGNTHIICNDWLNVCTLVFTVSVITSIFCNVVYQYFKSNVLDDTREDNT